MRVHSAVTITDSVAPFVINLVCTVTIICIVTKKKMKATGRGNGEHRVNRLRLLRSVWTENKELVIGPAFTLVPQLFSLPYFIASLILRCQNLQGDRLRYLLTVSYLTGFIPQLLSFVLVHLAIDVLSARMASNDAVSMAEEKHHRQTATGRHGGDEHSSYDSSSETLMQMH